MEREEREKQKEREGYLGATLFPFPYRWALTVL
jgi:hypothetical protein